MTDAEVGCRLDELQGTIDRAEPEAEVLNQSPAGGVDLAQKTITG